MFITETGGILPQGTHCSPPTIVVVEEFHAQGDVIGQRPQVLHEQVQGPEQEPAGLFDILTAQPSHKLPVVATIRRIMDLLSSVMNIHDPITHTEHPLTCLKPPVTKLQCLYVISR